MHRCKEPHKPLCELPGRRKAELTDSEEHARITQLQASGLHPRQAPRADGHTGRLRPDSRRPWASNLRPCACLRVCRMGRTLCYPGGLRTEPTGVHAGLGQTRIRAPAAWEARGGRRSDAAARQSRSAALPVLPATPKQTVPARCTRPQRSLRGPQPRTWAGRPSSQLPAHWCRQGKTCYVHLMGARRAG